MKIKDDLKLDNDYDGVKELNRKEYSWSFPSRESAIALSIGLLMMLKHAVVVLTVISATASVFSFRTPSTAGPAKKTTPLLQ
jgi:hypothetical protein